jgi:hypothetical protein
MLAVSKHFILKRFQLIQRSPSKLPIPQTGSCTSRKQEKHGPHKPLQALSKLRRSGPQ